MGGSSKRIQGLALALVTVMLVGTVASGAAVSARSQTTSVIVVDDDGGQGVDYTNIQPAVDNASAGDTIQVEPGTYNETVLVDKPLRLVGDPGGPSVGPGSDAPAIDGGGRNGSGITLAENVSNVTIEGFEIRHYVGNMQNGSGIVARGSNTSNVVVSDNYIHGILQQGSGPSGRFGGFGIATLPAPYSGTQHTGWRVVNNRVEDTNYDAVQFTNVANATITHNDIRGGQHILGTNRSSTYGVTALVGDYPGQRTTDQEGVAPDVRGVRIHNNTFTGTFTRYGIINLYVFSSNETDITLTDVNIVDNSLDGNFQTRGINVFPSGRYGEGNVATIGNLTIADNTVNGTQAGAIGMGGTNAENGEIRNVRITSNDLNNSRYSVNVDTDRRAPNISNVTIEDNLMRQAKAGGVRAENVDAITVRDNEIVGGGAGTPSNYAIAIVAQRGDSSAITVAENEVTGEFEIFGGVLNLWAFGEDANSSIRSATVSGNVLDVSTSADAPTRGINVFARGNSSIGTVGSIQVVTIQDNSVTGTNAGAIGLGGGFAETATIENVRVASSWLHDSGTGIGLHARDQYLIRNGTFVDNKIERIDGRGINFVTSQEGVLRDATLRNNTVLQINHTGIRLYPGGVSTIADVSFLNNTIKSTGWGGIAAYGRDKSAVSQLRIHNNSIVNTAHDGILLQANGQGSVRNVSVGENHIVEVKAGIAASANGEARTANVVVDGNTIRRSQYGYFSYADSAATVEGVTITKNVFANNTDEGVMLGSAPDAEVRNTDIVENLIANNTVGIRVSTETTALTTYIHHNRIVGNANFGVRNHAPVTLNATNNWWGDSSGPSSMDPENPVTDPVTGEPADGSGDAVSSSLHFDPWLESASAPVTVTGTVLEPDGTPAANDWIGFDTEDSQFESVKTDENGTFTYEAQPNTTYSVGYYQWDSNDDAYGPPGDGIPDTAALAVINTSTTQDLGTVVLPIGHHVDVRATDRTGAPIDNATGGFSVPNGFDRVGFVDLPTNEDGYLHFNNRGVTGFEVNGTVDVHVLGPEGDVENITQIQINSSRTLTITLGEQEAPIVVGSDPAQDADDDGKLEDVNGDGSFDILDVQVLFAHRNADVVTGNPDAFDFNGDGDMNILDVQALFAEYIG